MIAKSEIRNPKSEMKGVTVTINDHKIMVPEGTLLIEAAGQMGLTVPHFCYHPRLKPVAACRLCLVEITGMRGLQPSCATPVKEGMVVRTDTVPVLESHKEVLDLVLENHPLDCPKCEAAGRCQLEDFTYEFGPHRVSNYKPPGLSGIDYQEVAWSPLIKFDPYKCVECTRCIRVCDEIHDCTALTSESRGHSYLITTFANGPLHCDFCGSCASVCPTGAIELQQSVYYKKDWEYSKHEVICTHCSHGCTMVLKTFDEKIARVDDDYTQGINSGNLCSRGRFGHDIVDVEKRLRSPMLRQNGELKNVSWEDALAAAAAILKTSSPGPGPGPGPRGIVSGYLSVEDMFAFGLLLENLKGDKRSESRDGNVTTLIASKTGIFGGAADFSEIKSFKKIAVVDVDVEQIDYVAQVDIVAPLRAGTADAFAIGRIGPRIGRYVKPANQMPLSVDSIAAFDDDTLFVLDAERVPADILDAVVAKSRESARHFGVLLLAHQPNSRALGPLGFMALPLSEVSEVSEAKSPDTIIVAGPSHFKKRPAGCKNLIVSAHYLEGISLEADVVFPSAMSYEKPGTYQNSEGRLQSSSAAVRPQGLAWPDAAIWARLGKIMSFDIPQTPQDMIEGAQKKCPSLHDRKSEVARPDAPKSIGETALPIYDKYDSLLLNHSKETKTMTQHLEASREFAPWPQHDDNEERA